jgi:hypothetical protein
MAAMQGDFRKERWYAWFPPPIFEEEPALHSSSLRSGQAVQGQNDRGEMSLFVNVLQKQHINN